MAGIQTKDTTEQGTEKTQEKRKRPELAPEHVKVLADESIPFPGFLGDLAIELPIERHATLLGDLQFSHPANNPQKAQLVTQLQRNYGNTYVQRVIDSIDPAVITAQSKASTAIQRQSENDATQGKEKQAGLKAKRISGCTPPVTPELESRIKALSAGGKPLPNATRSLMQEHSGYDLGKVRIHTDNIAAETARDLKARAFTVGHDVVFGQEQYHPETVEGMRILAHELVHTTQQPQSSSNAVVRRLVHGAIPPGALPVKTETEREKIDRALKSRSKGDVKGIKNFQKATEKERLEMIDILTEGWVGPLDEYALEDIWNSFGDRVHVVAAANPARLKKSLEGGAELLEKVDAMKRFIERFGSKARGLAYGLLKESKARCLGEQKRYGITSKTVTTGEGYGTLTTATEYLMEENKQNQALSEAATELAAKLKEIAVLRQEQRQQLKYQTYETNEGDITLVRIVDNRKYNEIHEKIKQAAHEYDIVLAEKQAEYPILTAFTKEACRMGEFEVQELQVTAGLGVKTDSAQLARLKTLAERSAGMPRLIGHTIDDRLKNIKKAEDAIKEDENLVWKLPEIMYVTKKQMGVVENSPFDQLINTHAADIKSDELLENIVLAVLGICFAILAAIPTGGSSIAIGVGAALRIGQAGLSIYQAINSIQEYQLKSALAGTDFDKARALSQEEPQLFWVALDVIAVVPDVADCLKFFKGLSTPAKNVLKATDEAEQLKALDELRKAGDGIKPGLGSKLKQDAQQMLERLKKRFKKVEPEEVIEKPEKIAVEPVPLDVKTLRTQIRKSWMEDIAGLPDDVKRELEGMREWMARQLGGKRTGSVKATSDFDMTFDSYEQIDNALKKLKEWKLSSFEEAEKILGIGFYIDPKRMILYEELPLPLQAWARSKALREAQSLLKKGDYAAIKAEVEAMMYKGKVGLDAAKAEVDDLVAKFSAKPTMGKAMEIFRKQMAINISTGGAYISPGATKVWVAIRDGFSRSATTFLEAFTAFTEEYKKILPALKKALKEAEKTTAIKKVVVKGVRTPTAIHKELREICKHAKRSFDLAVKWGIKVDKKLMDEAGKMAEWDNLLYDLVDNPKEMSAFVNSLQSAQKKVFEEMAAVDGVLFEIGKKVGAQLIKQIPGAASLAKYGGEKAKEE